MPAFNVVLNILMRNAREYMHVDDPVHVMHLVKGVMIVVDSCKGLINRNHYQLIQECSMEVLNRADIGSQAEFPSIKQIFMQLQCTCIYANPVE